MVEMTQQQAIARLKMNENRLAQLQNQLASVGRAIEEIKVTISTIENLPTGGETGLLPLGGAFIPVKTTAENININIGAGVVVEKERKDAGSILRERESSLLEMAKRLQENGNSLRSESMAIQKKLNERANPNSGVPVISG